MDGNRRYRINSPNVIHETIDGEVVIINLATGCYYSLTGTGTSLWGLLEHGTSLDYIISDAHSRYEGEPREIENAIAAFVGELRQEDLITPHDGNGTVEDAPIQAALRTNGHDKKAAFTAPSLLKYTDMTDLILLDPIHEVDETGWPNRKAQPADGRR